MRSRMGEGRCWVVVMLGESRSLEVVGVNDGWDGFSGESLERAKRALDGTLAWVRTCLLTRWVATN